MKIAIWGAGRTGSGIARRLAVSNFASELRWINRTEETVRWKRIDLEHGLAFAPRCDRILSMTEDKLDRTLSDTSAVVLTQGIRVGPGEARADAYSKNRAFLRQRCIPALRGYKGFVLVVTNPVDVVARLVCEEADIRPERVAGLGTMVDTARLRLALAGLHGLSGAPRHLDIIAVGTHDEHMVPVLRDCPSKAGISIKALERARGEAAAGANRVKNTGPLDGGDYVASTIHPIAEGVHHVLGAILADGSSDLTVSTWDEDTGVFYSTLARGEDGRVERTDRPRVHECLRDRFESGIRQAQMLFEA